MTPDRDDPWPARGVCASIGGDLFFPGKGEPTAPAKLICRGCPVRRECATDALLDEYRKGVWGGLSERERAILRTRGWVAGDPLPEIHRRPQTKPCVRCHGQEYVDLAGHIRRRHRVLAAVA